jgi:antidote-toxin recognition MazE-like antitoxin
VAAQSSAEKVRGYRQRQRERGFRCIQIWVPDVTSPEFLAEAHRQSLLVNASDQAEADQAFIDAISDWGPNPEQT